MMVNNEKNYFIDHVFDNIQIAEFLKYTNDKNSIHYDESSATNLHYQGIIVPGLLVSSFFSALSANYLGGDKSIILSISLNFHKPVYLDFLCKFGGNVIYSNEDLKIKEANIYLLQNEEIKIKGKIKIQYQ